MDDDIPYLLLTPGPLTTSKTVKQVMLRDYCTWDDEYNGIVTDIRRRLVRLATSGGGSDEQVAETDQYTSILMQGSGTFSVEATIGSVIPRGGKLLVVDNGAYGRRIAQIAERLGIELHLLAQCEVEPVDLAALEDALASDAAISHVSVVHCETTTGLMNPAPEIGRLAARYGKTYILDAMSSFAGVPLTIQDVGADYLISSANKCVQGVPGFGFVLARRDAFEQTRGWARSLSLDLYDQWHEMETKGGKWRYTSPTHTVRAFAQAMKELDDEGGVPARAARYRENQRTLVKGMRRIGFRTLIADQHQSPIITSFLYPADPRFSFQALYDAMKRRRFVIYPGKVSHADTFRIATIGHVFPADVRSLLAAIEEAVRELKLDLGCGELGRPA